VKIVRINQEEILAPTTVDEEDNVVKPVVEGFCDELLIRSIGC